MVFRVQALPEDCALNANKVVKEVAAEHFHAFLREEERPEDETHLEDTQWLDEMELQYVE